MRSSSQQGAENRSIFRMEQKEKGSTTLNLKTELDETLDSRGSEYHSEFDKVEESIFFSNNFNVFRIHIFWRNKAREQR